jgi:hypothetical protein
MFKLPGNFAVSLLQYETMRSGAMSFEPKSRLSPSNTVFCITLRCDNRRLCSWFSQWLPLAMYRLLVQSAACLHLGDPLFEVQTPLPATGSPDSSGSRCSGSCSWNCPHLQRRKSRRTIPIPSTINLVGHWSKSANRPCCMSAMRSGTHRNLPKKQIKIIHLHRHIQVTTCKRLWCQLPLSSRRRGKVEYQPDSHLLPPVHSKY